MRIYRTGKISGDFYVVGDSRGPVYLLDGPEPVLFDAGFTALARIYERDIKEILGSRSPAYLFLTHAHFDHIGAARHIKDIWPEIRVACSTRAREIMARPRAVKLIRRLNQEVVHLMHSMGVSPIHEAQFETFDIDLTVTHGQTIELGPNLSIKAIHTPGHTRDFMSYWVPEKRVLVASEAAGCDDGTGYIETEFLVDYDDYRNSMYGLAELDPQVLCLGHRLVLTDRDAKEEDGKPILLLLRL